MMLSWLVVSLLAGATPNPPSDAVALEERAFAAIDSEQWCLAMRLFERAHDVAPAVGLVQNAARAAEFGNDLASAVRLQAAIAADAGATKAVRAAASKKIAELQKRLTSSGPVCPTLDVLEPPAAPSPVAVETPSATVPEERSTRVEAASTPNTGPLGAVVISVGGVAFVAGAATTVVGLLPWFAHADAGARVTAAELARTDATSAQQAQAQARADWEGYGQLATTVGGVVAGVGIATTIAGLVVILRAPPEESDASAPDDVDTDTDADTRTEESR